MEILFLAKKVITFFVEPFGLILVSGLVGFYFLITRSSKKALIFLSLSFSLLLFFSYPFIGNSLIQQLESQYEKYNYKDKSIEFIHVLGHGHYDNNEWPLSSQIGNSSLKRTFEGIMIFKKLNNPHVKLIFTGYAGKGNDTSNAEINASIARITGIKDENIIINGKPKDTKEEAEFTKSIVGNKSFVLVTSALHMPRAMKLFKDFGLNPIPAPTDFKGRSEIKLLSVPSIGSVTKASNAIHEYLGIAWTRLVSFVL